jgi:hypothetical protein
MQEHGSGWQDFLCANHSRNLHFDAFSRGYTSYVKDVLGAGLAEAKARSGGRLRIEADGESFVRSICKLTHVLFVLFRAIHMQTDARWTQTIQKRCAGLSLPSGHVLFFLHDCFLSFSTGQFRDYLTEHFPDLANTCNGQAELSKRYVLFLSHLVQCRHDLVHLFLSRVYGKQDWAAEACFHVYPLYEA